MTSIFATEAPKNQENNQLRRSSQFSELTLQF